jgi:hypothetical protein
MPIRPTEPDYALVLAALPPDDREAVERWLAVLGLEPEELGAAPALRQLVSMLAVLYVRAGMGGDLSRDASFQEAAGVLGLNGSSLQRTWHRWQERAARQFVSDEDLAA